MTTRCLLFAALALGLTSTASKLPAQEAGPLSDEDIAAIRAGHEAWVQVLLAGDWAAAAAWLTEDAVWMPPNNTVVRGRAAIEARLAERPAVTASTVTLVEIDGRDGLAYDRHTYSITRQRVGCPNRSRTQARHSWYGRSRRTARGRSTASSGTRTCRCPSRNRRCSTPSVPAAFGARFFVSSEFSHSLIVPRTSVDVPFQPLRIT